MKKFFTVVTALVLSLSTMVSLTVNAFAAPATKDVWSVGWTEDKKDFIGWRGDGGEFAVDTSTYTGNSRFSIKLTNTKADNYTSVSKVVKVEPLTTYKFSAMVKYSGEKPKSVSDGKRYGALLRQFYVQENGDWNYSYSNNVISNKWTKVECTLTTLADQNEIILSLYNGFVDTGCKGTAWFSDIKLEKAETTNKWNVLTVILKNVDVKVDLHDKTTIAKPKGKGLTRYTDSISSSGIKEIKEITEKLYSTMEELSGGLMDIKDIDFVTVDDTVTKLTNYDYDGDKWGTGAIHGYQIDRNCELVSKVLDEQLAKKQYHQIIVHSPLYGIAGGWMGNGGGDYKGVNFCQLHSLDIYYNENSEFSEGGIVHEILHCLERDTRAAYDPDMPSLHAAPDFGHLNGGKEWYSAYMRADLKGGKGIDKHTYYYPSGKYTLVDNDMTVGGEIKEAARLDISKCEIAPIEDRTYSGKKKGVALTITDGKYTLKKDIDYTVKYDNNINVGTARVTVTGKGIYKGTLKTTFRIVAEKPSAKLVKSGEYLKLTWSKDPDAKKYCIWQSVDGKNFKKLRELDSAKTTLKIKYNKKHTYQYAVTVYDKETKKWSDYIYSNKI